MADKSIEQLIAAEKVNATDLFVLQQSGTAKKLTGQILENWLLSFADGHGGIQSITKLSSSGLVDTYRITLADATVFDFAVTNGRSINSITQTSVSGLTRTYSIAFNDGSSQNFTVTDGRSITGISKTSTSGLVDTYTIEYNDGTTSTFIVNNGAKGDKGDNAYVWIKYASQEPTESSHSIGDIPDNWIGIYSGNAATAPTDWKQYKWFKNKGEQGETGSPATLLSKSVTYQVGDSGSIVPSGSWSSSVPVVAQGKYLWTKTELQFNTGDPIISYSVARMGLDGSGSVSSVNNVSPDENGNVALNAEDVGALPSTGGDMTGEIRMNGQPITGLNPPVNETDAVNKAYADQKYSPNNKPTPADIGALPTAGGTMNNYIDFNGSNGLSWTTTDGTIIHLRPYAPNNVFQITMRNPSTGVGEIGAVSLHTNGNWEFSDPTGVRDAIGAASATLAEYTPYGGRYNFSTNILHIDLNNPDAYQNKASVVATEDASTLVNSPIKSGPFYAYREVLFINNPNGGLPKCIVRLTQSYPMQSNIWINIYDPNIGWSGWEWDNPPMADGVEYRTTERYKGKPVYAKAVSLNLAGSGNKSVTVDDAMTEVVSFTAYLQNDIFAYDLAFNSNIVNCFVNVDSGNFFVNSTDMPGYTAKAIVKYIK